MCTHARIPSGSRRNESASSKSLAPSGSIVIVGRSRRSTRPSRVSAGSSYGSNSTRAPCSTSSASSTFSIRFALPILRSTRALPRPGRTTARSPALEPAEPLRVEHDRRPRREVRLAGDELAAPGDLDDEALFCRRRRPRREATGSRPLGGGLRQTA